MSEHLLDRLVPGASRDGKGACTYVARREWCTWNGLHGGTLMAALIGAMERTAGMAAVATTAQFIKGVREGDEISLHTEVLAASATVKQLRASAMKGGELVATALGTLGTAPAAARSDRVFPKIPSIEDSPRRTFLKAPLEGDMAETLEVRIAETGPTRASLWMRAPKAAGRPLSAARRAGICDHPPYAVRLALGGDWYGISLDAGLKLAVAPENFDAGDWVLVEIVFDAMASPFAFATANLWRADGTLLAVSPQTLRIRNGATPPKK